MMIKPKIVNRNVNISYVRQPLSQPVTQHQLLINKSTYRTPYNAVVVHSGNKPPQRGIRSKSQQPMVVPKKPDIHRYTPQQQRLLKKQQQSYDEYIKKIESIRDTGKGKIMVMIAPGPSILEVDLTKLVGNKHIDLMTINKPHHGTWPTRYWSFCDQTQYNRNQAAWDAYAGTIFNSGAVRARKHNQIIIKTRPGRIFSRDLTIGYCIGRTTTYASMQVALWLNYDKIYIFGVDMGRVTIEKDGKKVNLLHSYGTNPDVPEDKREQRFKAEAQSYEHGATELTHDECKRFYFCSAYNKWPFVYKYNKVDHRTAVDIILGEAKKLDR